ncbi:MAG: DUF1385 domain-containing protein, partial [Armatimonadota bacterium]|nr:DUF1385 domain-containing protein [Armatimonadota bacterium]
RRAAGLLRASGSSRLPVCRNGSIFGTISERAIAARLAAAEDLGSVLDTPIEPLVEVGVTLLDIRVSPRDAAGVFADCGEDVLPVTDDRGAFRGVLHRRDLLAYLTRNLRPPMVAGMATPLGVYLTTGAVSGGAGSAGLFLTGVSLSLMIILSGLIVDLLQRLFSIATGINVSLFLASPPLTSTPNIYDAAFYLTTVLTIVVFFVLMRVSPLSGYHAAEHMTVHAIESGDVLTYETVRKMPRVHPRCGTNLLAAAGAFVILTTKTNSSVGVLLALVVVVIGWRAVGAWLQYFVTTKDPSRKQIESGIAAGQELLERYQAQPNRVPKPLERIWNIGLLQTAAGMVTVLSLAQQITGLNWF